MSDLIVTIRVPEGLLSELNGVVKEDHFLDLSEAVRSILRSHYLVEKNPYLHEIRQLRQDITDEVKEKSQKIAWQMLTDELKKIKRELE